MLKLGPILKFLGCENDEWRLGLLAVTADADLAPELSIAGKLLTVKSQQLLSYTKSKLWLWEFSVTLAAKAQSVEYKFNNVSYSITVPAKNQKPAIAYASCNGFSDPKVMKNVADQNALWKRMKALHDGVDTIRTTRYGP